MWLNLLVNVILTILKVKRLAEAVVELKQKSLNLGLGSSLVIY